MDGLLNIKVRDEEYCFNKKEIKMVLDVSVNLKRSLEDDYSRVSESVEREIKRRIVEHVTDKYLGDMEDAIIHGIDLDSIIKRCQLKTVERVLK